MCSRTRKKTTQYKHNILNIAEDDAQIANSYTLYMPLKYIANGDKQRNIVFN